MLFDPEITNATIPQRIVSLLEFSGAAAVSALRRRKLQKIRLPFRVDAPTRTYPHAAHASGILSATDVNHPALLNFNVLLVLPAAKIESGAYSVWNSGDVLRTRVPRSDLRIMDEGELDFFPGARLLYERIGLLQQVPILAGDQIMRDSSVRIEAVLLEALRSGLYIQTFVNEFFVPRSPSYLRRNFRHRMLITGCNERELIVPMYSSRGVFEEVAVSPSLVIAGVRSRMNRRGGEECPRFFRGIRRMESNMGINLPLVAQQLRDFWRATITFGGHLPAALHAAPPFPVVVGSAVYPAFRQYIINADKMGEPVDLRASRIIAEHAGLMERRFQCISAHEGAALPAGLSGQLRTWVLVAECVHRAACAYRAAESSGVRRKSRSLLMDSILNLEQVVQAAERDCLDFVLGLMPFRRIKL